MKLSDSNHNPAHVRSRHLSRKFFAIWRDRTQRNVLNRRAKHRRKLLATAMQTEMDRKRRDEAELEAILAATRETKQLQEQQKRMTTNSNGQNATTASPSEIMGAPIRSPQMVGRKRKIIPQPENARSVSGTPAGTWSNHKRSRTVDSMSEPSTTTGLSASLNTFRISNSIGGLGFGRSLANRLGASTNSQRSLSQRVDSTKTDYFKLKAMGIDPNTPLVPDTVRSLAEKRTKLQQERQELLERSRTRPSVFSTSVTSRPSSPSMEPPGKSNRVAVQSSPLRSMSTTPNPTPSGATLLDEDSFLRQLREARESLASDADWFKNQTVLLEKEIVQQEDLRKSLNSQSSSQYGSPRLSVSGYASVNGLEYYSLETKPGTTLSRTEARIRRTGAHGLATRAVGNDYVPVAMSRKSASRHGYGLQEKSFSSGTKRRRSEAEPAISTTAKQRHTEMHGEIPSVIGSAKPSIKKAVTSYNAFAALQDEHSEEDAEDEFDEEAEDSQYDGDGVNGDSEDESEDLIEDDEGEEDESEEQNGSESAHQYAVLGNLPLEERTYDDEDEYDEEDEDEGENDTPGTYPEFSRAQSRSSTGVQSGPGASMDDAVVLSD